MFEITKKDFDDLMDKENCFGKFFDPSEISCGKCKSKEKCEELSKDIDYTVITEPVQKPKPTVKNIELTREIVLETILDIAKAYEIELKVESLNAYDKIWFDGKDYIIKTGNTSIKFTVLDDPIKALTSEEKEKLLNVWTKCGNGISTDYKKLNLDTLIAWVTSYFKMLLNGLPEQTTEETISKEKETPKEENEQTYPQYLASEECNDVDKYVVIGKVGTEDINLNITVLKNIIKVFKE